MSTISASTTTTTAFRITTDTAGTLVFQTGSTPTTAMTLGSDQSVTFAGTPTYSGGTANGVAYLNGSKVLTTGSALQFDGTNLGLGATPSAWSGVGAALQVGSSAAIIGNSAGSASLLMNAYYNGSAYTYINTAAASRLGMTSGAFAFYTAGSGTAGNAITFTQAMTLDASGNLGIGTTSPSSTFGFARFLEISGTTAALVLNPSNTTSGCGIEAKGAVPLRFAINGSEAARIDSSGNLLVGTTSATGKFTSVSTTTTPAGYFSTSGVGRVLQVMSTSGADSAQPGIYIGKFANDSTTSQRFMLFSINNDATGSGQINANGASQAAFGSFSDARLKENIVDLAPQLSNIMALRPVEFDYKTGGHQTGFVAQEMQQVFPDAVGSDGSEDQYLTVTGWNKTEAILVKAIQEQQAIIQELNTRLEALEAK